jgi:hypothetical protein
LLAVCASRRNIRRKTAESLPAAKRTVPVAQKVAVLRNASAGALTSMEEKEDREQLKTIIAWYKALARQAPDYDTMLIIEELVLELERKLEMKE